jgi:hypothetical protein
LPQQHLQLLIKVISFMLQQVLKCQTLIMASAVLACEGKEKFEALREFFKTYLG